VEAAAVSVNARGMGEGKPQSMQRQRQRDTAETPNTNAVQRTGRGRSITDDEAHCVVVHTAHFNQDFH